MSRALVNELASPFGSVYPEERKESYASFLGDFVTGPALRRRLSPNHPHSSTFVDATLRLPGVGEVPKGVPPFVTTRYLEDKEQERFIYFREVVVGGVSTLSETKPIDIVYIPPSVFFGLIGLPDEVKALELEPDTETTVAALSMPYNQTNDLPDLSDDVLWDRLGGRPSLGVAQKTEGSGWSVNVVLALHETVSGLGRFVIGRTGLSTDGGNDIVYDLFGQLRAREIGVELHLPTPSEVAQILYDHSSSGR